MHRDRDTLRGLFVGCAVVFAVAAGLRLLPEPKRAKQSDMDRLWLAIIDKETNSGRNRESRLSLREQSVGIAQIRPILVKDCNRIVGYPRWTLADREDDAKSREMFDVYLGHYGKGRTTAEMAAMWNGGPDGHKKPKSQAYARDVMRRIR